MAGEICSYWWTKIIVSSSLVVLGFFFDVLQFEAMMAVLFLIVIDFITALWSASKMGDMIQSHKIFRSAFKTTAYFTLIAAAHLAEKAIPISIIDETVIAFLATTELISILENVSKAGYAIPKMLLERLKIFNQEK